MRHIGFDRRASPTVRYPCCGAQGQLGFQRLADFVRNNAAPGLLGASHAAIGGADMPRS
jgi:hypothetical protein